MRDFSIEQPCQPAAFPGPAPQKGGDGEWQPPRRPLRPAGGRTAHRRTVLWRCFLLLHRDAGINRPVGDITVIHPLPPPSRSKTGRPPGAPGTAWRSGWPGPAWRTAPSAGRGAGQPAGRCSGHPPPGTPSAAASPSGPSGDLNCPEWTGDPSPLRPPGQARRPAPTQAPQAPPPAPGRGARAFPRTGPGP